MNKLYSLFLLLVSNYSVAQNGIYKIEFHNNYKVTPEFFLVTVYLDGKEVYSKKINDSNKVTTITVPFTKPSIAFLELNHNNKAKSTVAFVVEKGNSVVKTYGGNESNTYGIESYKFFSPSMVKYENLMDSLNRKYPLLYYPQTSFDSIQTIRDKITAKFLKRNKTNLTGLFTLYTIVNNHTIALKEKRSLFNTLSTNLKSSYVSKLIDATISGFENMQEGKKILTLKLVDSTNRILDINSIRDKVILIDVWASWCAPCRENNPKLLKFYEKYKSSGFEIFGISLDENVGNWKKAIIDEKLTWINVIESTKNSSFNKTAKLLNISGIPRYLLVDKNKVIINPDIRIEEIEPVLKGLLFTK